MGHPPALAPHMGGSPDAFVRHFYHVGPPRVTGGGEGSGDPPQVPYVIVEAKPGVPEAEFLRNVGRMQALVARYDTLLDTFTDLRTSIGPPAFKKALTVLALVNFLAPDRPPAGLALVLDLFPPMAAKHYSEAMRGMIAAAVAILRSADMENLHIEQWLSEELERRALNFGARNAMRWFFDCNSKTRPVPRSMLKTFCLFRPSESLTEAEAKKQVATMLDTVVETKAGPLTQAPRRRG